MLSLLFVHVIPIQIREERMPFDLFNTQLGSEPLVGVLLEKTFDQVKACPAQMGSSELFGDNVFLHLELICIVEGWQASYELIKEDTKTVEVKRQAITLVLQDLGAEVLWAATDSFGLVISGKVLLGKAEVGELQVAPFIYQYIFWL